MRTFTPLPGAAARAPASPLPHAPRRHRYQGFSQGALIHMGAMLAARLLSEKMESSTARWATYSLFTLGATFVTSLLRERALKNHEQEHAR